ncbi:MULTISPECIES: nodulation protein NolB [Mesorhizobium]|uniref:nodulation protein NolB n=1 Tax=Mesorhizobium TaxID=68287 RepID=UPI00049A94ED|nr:MULTISPECIES: nodulation protein NolB [Mesorhizobium]
MSDQAQFERALAHAADALKNDAPLVLAPPVMDVQRAAAKTNSLGDRVVEKISSMFAGNAVSPLDWQVGLSKGSEPGPPQKLTAETGPGTGTSGVSQGGRDFEAMIVGLRDLYNGVTQVALVSKGVSGITSSLNKLLKEG